ncbi:methyltransferase family protein [Williamsia muralis]|nr:class I SAM-dependent methyltransferase [Williamsia marianensis]PVY27631.1 methyltransferase family protein [Williamsia marianensis]
MEQPGYDAMADLYAATFPHPFLTALEEHAVAAFADTVRDRGADGPAVDVGCGLGQVTAFLAERGLTSIGIDPSEQMLARATREFPHLDFVQGDATLDQLNGALPIAAILARFSLIHIPPEDIPDVLRCWASRTFAGAPVLVACQISSHAGQVEQFDHKVAPAWRWHPDRLAADLSDAGFDEVWRAVSQPDDQHRFADVHMLATRR